MTEIQTNLDVIMCCLWVLTYTVVLIGTIRYRYPLIAPMAQAIIAPFEFAVLYRILINGNLGLDYVSLAYLYWTFVELAIIYVMIRREYMPRKYVGGYIILVSALTCVMCYVVGHKDQMFFFSYFNTFIGELVWLYHICKTDYPMKPLSMVAFMAKFIGDAISVPVYWGAGPLLIDFICLALPILDFMFIVMYLYKKDNIYFDDSSS